MDADPRPWRSGQCVVLGTKLNAVKEYAGVLQKCREYDNDMQEEVLGKRIGEKMYRLGNV